MSAEHRNLPDILESLHTDPKVRTAVLWEDGAKLSDGLLKRGLDTMIKYASQWRIRSASLSTHSINESHQSEASERDQLDEKDITIATKEMTCLTAYITLCAQNPPHVHMIDFFLMHCLNASIFYPTFFAKIPSLTAAQKARLLEFKVRSDLATYASRGSAKLLPREVISYKPKDTLAGENAKRYGALGPWSNIYPRFRRLPDDGHAIKAIRALAWGEQLCSHSPLLRCPDPNLPVANDQIDGPVPNPSFAINGNTTNATSNDFTEHHPTTIHTTNDLPPNGHFAERRDTIIDTSSPDIDTLDGDTINGGEHPLSGSDDGTVNDDNDEHHISSGPIGATMQTLMGDEMWLLGAHIVVDSVEAAGSVSKSWVRGAGFQEAWAGIPLRPTEERETAVEQMKGKAETWKAAGGVSKVSI